MVMVANLDLTGRKVVTAERDGGIIIFSVDNKTVELDYEATNILLDFLTQKREMEERNVKNS